MTEPVRERHFRTTQQAKIGRPAIVGACAGANADLEDISAELFFGVSGRGTRGIMAGGTGTQENWTKKQREFDALHRGSYLNRRYGGAHSW